MRVILIAVILWCAVHGLVFGLCGQHEKPSETATVDGFEAASVRPNKSGSFGSLKVQPAGLTVQGAPLKFCIQWAFDIIGYQVLGGPRWISSERYDILAKAPARASRSELRRMFQQLLAERFKLRVHRETRRLPIYSLVVTTHGPKLRQSQHDRAESIMVGRGQLIGSKLSMARLADALSGELDWPVVDSTGLGGYFDIKLEWSPEESEGRAPSGEGATAPGAGDVRPSIFTAVQEQLGLKLESTKGPVDVVIVDHAEKPSPN